MQSSDQQSSDQDETTRSQVRGSTLLLSGRMIALFLNLAVQVLMVRYLAKLEYGAFAFAIAMVSVATNLSLFGLDKTLARFMAIYHERQKFQKMAGTIVLILVVVAGCGLAISLGVIGLRAWIGDYLASDPLSLTLLLTLIFLVPIDGMDAVFRSIFGVLGDVRTVFFRRYVLGPLLKLMAVAGVILFQASVDTLALFYLAASLIGLTLYIVLFIQIIQKENLKHWFQLSQLRFPAREIFGFSVPLLSSQLSFLSRTALIVILLEALLNSEAVADFRSVIPFARLNLVVITSFTFLFTPLASRMFARRDSQSINDLYWTSAIWVMVLSFPALMLTTVFAEPLTMLMFGPRYEASAMILALMSIGFFFDAALGFTVQTLRVHAQVRYIVFSDIVSFALAITLFLIMIPRFGSLGAACAAMVSMGIQNVIYFVCMRRTTGFGKIQWKYLRLYAAAVALAAVLLFLYLKFTPNIIVSCLLIALASTMLIYLHRETLQAQYFFPELLRIPILGHLFSSRHSYTQR